MVYWCFVLDIGKGVDKVPGMRYSAWNGPREKYVLRNAEDPESLTVCLGIRWDTQRLMIGGPIGMLRTARNIMGHYREWEETECVDEVKTGINAGMRSPKFKLYYRSTAKTPSTHQRHWRELVKRLEQGWVLIPVKSFNRLVG